MKKFAIIILIIVMFFACTPKRKPIGGDKDKHGCLGPAGYTWCEAKKKCIRPWEEKCE
jgi:hypothetical protein